MNIEFYRHNIGEEEIKKVTEILYSSFLTTGKTVYEFENKFSAYLGTKYTIGVMSCTAALQLSLLAFDIGPGDEVITTPMSFVATANAILHTGARPVFVDVELAAGNMEVDLIEKFITVRTKAIIPVHLYGQMCDMKRIKRIADRHKLIIIEDCAHCIEGERDKVRPGQLSDTACFSFYTTKSLTCGEGGAISTNNLRIADKLRRMRLHGLTKNAEERYRKKYQHWDMDILGWKYNMDNIKAALLLNQIDYLDIYWKRREEIYNTYKKAFQNIKHLNLLEIYGKSALHLFTILVKPYRRNQVLHLLQEKGVGVAVNYRAIHNLSFYRKMFGFKPTDFPNANLLGNSTISLPFYPRLTDEEVGYVIKTVCNIVR